MMVIPAQLAKRASFGACRVVKRNCRVDPVVLSCLLLCFACCASKLKIAMHVG